MGAEGRIRSFDSSKQRFIVDLGEKSLSLRAANLLQLLPVRFRCRDEPDAWRDAEVVGFDADTDELLFRSSCGETGRDIDVDPAPEEASAPLRGRLDDPMGP